jgi:hypothetical protein
MVAPHDLPDAASLLEAVREFLERDVMGATEGRIRFHARVAVNVLAMVEREWELGPAQAVAHREGLARLGYRDEQALARAIRSGEVTGRHADEVAAFVRETVRNKLLVANPRYLEGPRPPPD